MVISNENLFHDLDLVMTRCLIKNKYKHKLNIVNCSCLDIQLWDISQTLRLRLVLKSLKKSVVVCKSNFA